MMNDTLYTRTSFDTSRTVTRNYSTSFYSAAGLLAPGVRAAIYGIYGFVRLADEIVDTFSGYRQEVLLDRLETDYETARLEGISLNPVVNAFVTVVRHYDIDDSQVRAFIKSMRADLWKKQYRNADEIRQYIYGSADVVGLMCLKVFTNGNAALYQRLKEPAMKLGSAFQKVNFLRDLKSDTETLCRSYFPSFTTNGLDETGKAAVIREIENEFAEAYEGIRQLPPNCRLGVYVAYTYYLQLLKKIKQTPACMLMLKRIRISGWNKLLLLTRSFVLEKVDSI